MARGQSLPRRGGLSTARVTRRHTTTSTPNAAVVAFRARCVEQVDAVVDGLDVSFDAPPSPDMIQRLTRGAQLLKLVGRDERAEPLIGDGIAWLTAHIDNGALSEGHLHFATGALNGLHALKGTKRRHSVATSSTSPRVWANATLRPILREETQRALTPGRYVPADVAPLINAAAQMLGHDPFLNADDGELLARLLQLDPDASVTLSASVESLRHGHTAIGNVANGRPSIVHMLGQVRATLAVRTGGAPFADGTGAPRLPVPAATSLTDAKRRLAGLLDNTLASANLPDDQLPTATVAVDRATLDELVALGYRPVIVEQIPRSFTDLDGHQVEGIAPLPGSIPRERARTEGELTLAAHEPRWHLGAIAHYKALPIRGQRGRTAEANALVILGGAPVARRDLNIGALGENLDTYEWARGAITLGAYFWGPSRPAAELAVPCAHESTRWLPARCVERADTMMLCCVACQRRGFTSVPTHRLPDGHPEVTRLTQRTRSDQLHYVAGERVLRQMAGAPPLRADMSLAQLRAEDDVADLDAIAAAALARHRPRSHAAAANRTLRAPLGRR